MGNALKLNFDGSSMGNPGPMGMGGTFCDASNLYLLAYSGPLGIRDVIYVEAMSLLFGNVSFIRP